jgi:hypothetical protein
MSIDYAELAAIATDLIAEAGREVTIIRFQQAPDDAAKPWRGPADPRGTPDATDDVVAAFVSPSAKFIDSDLIKRSQAACLVGPGANFDLATANEVIDGDTHWRITAVEVVKPGDTILLYIIGVSR